MKALFDHYTDAGNIGGDATNVYVDTLKGNTLLRVGDKLFFNYLINSTVSSFSVKIGLYTTNIALTDIAEGNNSIDIYLTYCINGGYRARILLNNSSGSFIYYSSCSDSECINFTSDRDLKLILQDTSESPADNTVIAKMGTVLLIPAS